MAGTALVIIERKADKRLASGVPREIILDTLDRLHGNVDETAKELSINYVSLSSYIDKDTELRALTIKHRESILDKAEKELRTSIEQGNLTMVRFALRTLGKDRGYVERSEKDIRKQDVPPPKELDLSKLSVDELKILQSLQARASIDTG